MEGEEGERDRLWLVGIAGGVRVSDRVQVIEVRCRGGDELRRGRRVEAVEGKEGRREPLSSEQFSPDLDLESAFKPSKKNFFVQISRL